MSLRKKAIKLAYQHPDLRPHLLPLLKEGQRQVSFGEAQEAIRLALNQPLQGCSMEVQITQMMSRSGTLMRYLTTTVPVFGWDRVMQDLLPLPIREWMVLGGLTEEQAEARWEQMAPNVLNAMRAALRAYRP